MQTRKIKEKDSETQAVPLERKKNPNQKTQTNQASMNTHQIFAGSPPEKANLFSVKSILNHIAGMQSQIRHWSSQINTLLHFIASCVQPLFEPWACF